MGVEGCETQLHALACRHLAYPTSPMKVSCWEHNGCGCIGVELISQPAHPTAVQCLYKQEGATNQNSLACAKHDSRAHEATRFHTQACRSAIDIDQAGLHWFLALASRTLRWFIPPPNSTARWLTKGMLRCQGSFLLQILLSGGSQKVPLRFYPPVAHNRLHWSGPVLLQIIPSPLITYMEEPRRSTLYGRSAGVLPCGHPASSLQYATLERPFLHKVLRSVTHRR